MRHHKANRKFGRVRKQRTALLKTLAVSLILKEKIKTTEAKAKELRPFVEKIISAGKGNDLSARRLIVSKIGAGLASKKVIEIIAPKYKSRNGGYTRISKMLDRKSDGSKMAQIEFV